MKQHMIKKWAASGLLITLLLSTFTGCIVIQRAPIAKGSRLNTKNDLFENIVSSTVVATGQNGIQQRESRATNAPVLYVKAEDLECFSVDLVQYAKNVLNIPEYSRIGGTNFFWHGPQYINFLYDLEEEWIKQVQCFESKKTVEYINGWTGAAEEIILFETVPKYADLIQQHIIDFHQNAPEYFNWKLVRVSNYFVFIRVYGNGEEQNKRIRELEQKVLDTASVFSLREKIEKGEPINAKDVEYYSVNLDYYIRKQFIEYQHQYKEYGYYEENGYKCDDWIEMYYITSLWGVPITSLRYFYKQLADGRFPISDVISEGIAVFVEENDAYSTGPEGWYKGFVVLKSADEAYAQCIETEFNNSINDLYELDDDGLQTKNCRAVHVSNYTAFFYSYDNDDPAIISTMVQHFLDSESIFTLRDRMVDGEHIIIK